MSGTVERKFVVNFLRDRDAYHVPAALKNAGMLDRLVTDVYYDAVPDPAKAIFRSISDHRSDLLPPQYVENCYGAAVLQQVDRKFVRERVDMSFLSDTLLDLQTRSRIRKRGASALLYSGYAEHSFKSMVKRGGDRFLFLFHPHYKYVLDILNDDAEKYPQFKGSFARDLEVRATWRHRKADTEIALTQGLIAASGFSIRSARHAGFSGPAACVPYFTDFPANRSALERRAKGEVKFLFVGQGVQRKGLHHLFEAWKGLDLPKATLTCVCSRMDSSIAQGVPSDVILKKGLSREELLAEYDSAHVFVMPSLIEGFGLVYLEAMRRGAFVIGTENTGLPDINAPESMARAVTVGDIEALRSSLNDAYRLSLQGGVDHDAIVRFSEIYGFSEYAQRLADAIVHLSDGARRRGE